jgi:hypothetical protein
MKYLGISKIKFLIKYDLKTKLLIQYDSFLPWSNEMQK